MSTLQRALEIAISAHSDVIDKSGCLYIFHPIRLVLKAQSENEKIVAALHDVVEDCDDWCFDRLRDEGFSDVVLDAIDRLTKRDGEAYADFIERCCGSLLSIQVKLLDISDNMDITRLPTMDDKDLERMKKYHKSRLRLMEALSRAEFEVV